MKVMFTMLCCLTMLAGLLVPRHAFAAESNMLLLDNFTDLAGWTVSGEKVVTVVKDPKEGQYLLWHSTSRTGTALVKDLTPIKDKLAGYDAICFEYLMDGDPSSAYMTLDNLPGYPSARNWYFKFSYNHRREWRTARFEFRLDDDSPGNPAKDPRTKLTIALGGWMASAKPMYEWRIKNLRAVRYPVTLDYDEAAKNFTATPTTYTYPYPLHVQNKDTVDHECALVFDRRALKHFTLTAPDKPFMVKAGASAVVTATLSIPISAAKKLEPLYTEPAPVVLRVKELAETDTTVLRGWQEVPLFGTVPPAAAKDDLHPRVCCDPTRLAELRKWITEEGDFKGCVNYVKGGVDGLLKMPVVVPTFPGGYNQINYVCPVCKSPLNLAYDARSLKEAWCPTCKAWVTAPYLIQRAATDIHFCNANMAYHCALLYALTGETKYAERAKEVLLDYAKAAPTMKPVNGQATGYINLLAWCTLGESYACRGFPFAFDFLQTNHYLTPAESTLIENNFLLPLAKRLSMHNGTYSNQTAEYRSHQMAIGLACGNWVMAGRALNWDFGFREMVQYGFDADGWSIEGSTGYQAGCVFCMDEMADQAYFNGIDVYRGNEKYQKILRLTGLEHVLNARFHEPYTSKDAIRRGGLDRWFYCTPRTITYTPPVNKQAASYMQDASGYTFLRFGKSDSFNGLDMNWGQTWERSEHDLFSYKVYLRGTRADGGVGRLAYTNPACFFESESVAASGIVVDRKRSAVNRQFGCLIDGGDKFAAGLVTTNPTKSLYADVEMTRYFTALPEGLLLVDVVNSPKAHDLEWSFYPPRPFTTSLTGLQPLNWNAPKYSGYDVPFDLQHTRTDGAFTFQWQTDHYGVRRTVAGGENKEIVTGKALGTWEGIPIPFSMVSKHQVQHAINAEFFEAYDTGKEPALTKLTYTEQGGQLRVTLDFAGGSSKIMAYRPTKIVNGNLLAPEKGNYISEIK